MFKNLGAFELLIIVAIVLLLFGGKKIPELMRGLGKGMNEFKKASEGKSDDAPTDSTQSK
ncbi:MAG: twin-arginine translocase TatA/TatE family subunit [bacterium]